MPLPLALMGVGLASGMLQGYGGMLGGRKAARQNSPWAILERANTLNPWLSAYGNQYDEGNASPFAQQMRQLVTDPGYVDPQLMNQSLNLSAMREGTDLQSSLSKIGQTQGMGGLASALPLASSSARTLRDVGTHNQYGQLRENLRRQDMQFLMDSYQKAMAGASQGQQFQAGLQSQIPTWSSMLGQGLQGGLAAYGTMPDAQQAQSNIGGSPNMGPHMGDSPGRMGQWQTMSPQPQTQASRGGVMPQPSGQSFFKQSQPKSAFGPNPWSQQKTTVRQ